MRWKGNVKRHGEGQSKKERMNKVRNNRRKLSELIIDERRTSEKKTGRQTERK